MVAAMDKSLLWLITVITVILDHVICKDEILVKSCPLDKRSWDTAARRKECRPEGGSDLKYHCVKNEHQQLVETCMVAQWIETGVCPILFDSGDFGGENCPISTGGTCPKLTYRSNEIYKFPLCFVPKPTSTTTDLTTTLNTTTENIADIDVNRDCGFVSGGLIAGIIVPLLVFSSIVCILNRRKSREKDKNENIDTEPGAVLSEEMIPLTMLTNKQADQQKEKQIVNLSAYADGVNIIKETAILIITGGIGSGKTTAMNRVIKLLQEDGLDLRCRDISFWRKERYNEDHVLVKWDDCFGRYVANPVKIESTKSRLKDIFKWISEGDGGRALILTMSEANFKYFNVRELVETESKRIKNCKVCVDNLSENEKNSMVKKISKNILKPSVKKDKMNLQTENESISMSTLSWPSLCFLVAVPYVSKNMILFTKDPLKCMMNLFDHLLSDSQELYCAMIYVLFKGGNANIHRFDSHFLKVISAELAPEMVPPTTDSENVDTDDSVRILIRKLCGILSKYPYYLKQVDEEQFEFHNSIFSVWLLSHFYERFPKITIQYLSFDYLTELLRPDDYVMESYELDISIICSFDKKGNIQRSSCKNINASEKSARGEEDIPVQQGHPKASREVEIAMEAKNFDHYQSEETTTDTRRSWRFVLHESMYSWFIDRLVKEKPIEKSSQEEEKQGFQNLEDHPILKNLAFQRMYTPRRAVERTKKPGSKFNLSSIKGALSPSKRKFEDSQFQI